MVIKTLKEEVKRCRKIKQIPHYHLQNAKKGSTFFIVPRLQLEMHQQKAQVFTLMLNQVLTSFADD